MPKGRHYSKYERQQITAKVNNMRRGGKVSIKEACRRAGVSEKTFYTWRMKTGDKIGASNLPTAPEPAEAEPTESTPEASQRREGGPDETIVELTQHEYNLMLHKISHLQDVNKELRDDILRLVTGKVTPEEYIGELL